MFSVEASRRNTSTGRKMDQSPAGERLPGQKWNKNRPGQLYNEAYGLPKQLIGGKDKITIRFQGRPGNFAGGAFECRVLKKE